MLGILDIVWVDGVEVVRRFRFQHKTVINPSVVRTFGVEGFVGGKRDAGCVLSEERVSVVEAVLPVLKGDIGCPEIGGGWTPFSNPLRNRVEDMTAHPPVFKILGAPYRKLSTAERLSGCKDVIGCAVFCDRRVVGKQIVALEMINEGRLRCDASSEQKQRRKQDA